MINLLSLTALRGKLSLVKTLEAKSHIKKNCKLKIFDCNCFFFCEQINFKIVPLPKTVIQNKIEISGLLGQGICGVSILELVAMNNYDYVDFPIPQSINRQPDQTWNRIYPQCIPLWERQTQGIKHPWHSKHLLLLSYV